ncbi:hypothetical protein MNV49_007185 [Pseudohyphozyma bogoriensis]|nr:hypothetical protein MNV49_007185 [Pseudohyphozyma bogoriensis]
MSAGQPLSRKALKLASSSAALASSQSSSILPSEIASLRLRHIGLKGNSGVRHWAKDSLPAIRFANPALKVTTIQPATPSASSSTSTSTTAEPWKLPPGVFIGFNDPALPEAFLPFPPKTNSTALADLFWKTVEDPVALEALRASGVSEEPAASHAQAESVVEEVKRVEVSSGLPGTQAGVVGQA